ncbi:ATP-binding protein [Microcoleus sp. herbarium5]|uniref:ATP-binding protein n=1 Tax=Microcoleus sp. herbarium5 TaxID=3055434 RepID=UPI002FD7235E
MSSTPKARGVSLTPAGVELLKNRMSDITREVDKISDQHLARLADVKTEVVGQYNKNQNSITLEDANKIEQAKEKASKKWTKPVLVTVAAVSIDTIDRMFKPTGVDVDSIKSVASALRVDPRLLVDPIYWPRFVDNQPELKGELSKFQSLIDRKLKRFVGRRFVFDAIENFFSSNSNGYFTIVAEPGLGKSTILAKYICDKEKQCVAFFNERTIGRNTPDQFLRSVCTQLIDRYNLGYVSLPVHSTSDGEFLGELLQKVSDQLPSGERLVIAIDALDEVDENSKKKGTNICYLPRYLPDNVYFLLSRRPFISENERLLTEAPKQDFYLWKYPKESEKDVKDYIRLFLVDPEFEESLCQWIETRNLTKETFTEVIAQNSQNNFMYLCCVLPAIATGFYQHSDLKGLPKTLEVYYEDHWEVQGMNTTQKRDKVIIICILLKLSEKVSCELIADIAKPDIKDISEVQELLDGWHEFFNQEELEEEICYSFYHLSYVEFLEDKLEKKKLTVTREEINNRILDYFEKEMDEEDE